MSDDNVNFELSDIYGYECAEVAAGAKCTGSQIIIKFHPIIKLDDDSEHAEVMIYITHASWRMFCQYSLVITSDVLIWDERTDKKVEAKLDNLVGQKLLNLDIQHNGDACLLFSNDLRLELFCVNMRPGRDDYMIFYKDRLLIYKTSVEHEFKFSKRY